jgi:cysteine-rich repeat protein
MVRRRHELNLRLACALGASLFWFCGTDEPVATSTCGDGEVSATEACDDFNLAGGDGCSPLCVVESGFTCTVSDLGITSCVTTCGDTIQAGSEQCDDGNAASGDGCSSACLLEAGASELCANGIDDDEDTLLDCVDPDCFAATECAPAGEANCEDEVDNDTDGAVDCADLDCVGEADCGPETTEELCGDVRDNDGDGRVDCADDECEFYCDPVGECGDGVTQQGEECDEGTENSDAPDAACRPTCQLADCGDAIKDSDEVCDDGEFAGPRCRVGCVGSPLLACPDVDPAVDLNSPQGTRSGDRFTWSGAYPGTQRVNSFTPPADCGADGADIGVAFTAPTAGLWLFSTAFDGTSRLSTVAVVSDCEADTVLSCGGGRGAVVGGSAAVSLTSGQDVVVYLTNSSGSRGGNVNLVARPITALLELGDDCSSDPAATTVCDPAAALRCGVSSGECEEIPLDERQAGEACDPAGRLDRCARALFCEPSTSVCTAVVGSTCDAPTVRQVPLVGSTTFTFPAEVLRSAVSGSCDVFDRGHILELRTTQNGWVDVLVESGAGASPSVVVVRPGCSVPSSETSCTESDPEGIASARMELAAGRGSLLVGADDELTVRTLFVPYPDAGEDCDPSGVVNRCPSDTFCLNSGECGVPAGPTCDAPIDLLAAGTGTLDRGLVVVLETVLTTGTQVGTCGGDGVDIAGVITMPQDGLLRVNYVSDDPELVYHVRSDCFDVETELACVSSTGADTVVSVPYQELLFAGDTRYFLFDSNDAARGSVVITIKPRASRGEACDEVVECLPGLRCEPGVNTCQLIPIFVGLECETGDRCEDGAYCSPDDGVCTRLHGDGQECPASVSRSCESPQVCLPGSGVVDGSGRCSNVVVQSGEGCASGLVSCDTGLGCYTTGNAASSPGVCVLTPVSDGNPCSAPGALCAAGLNCVTAPGRLSGNCQSTAATLGSACGPGVAGCEASTLVCFREPGDSFGICGLFADVPDGGACTSADMCASGTCEIADGNEVGACGSVGANVGEACVEDADCAFFFRCSADGSPGVCYLPRFVGESCSDDPTEQCLPEWFNCEGGECVSPSETFPVGASCETRAWCGESGICHPLDGKLSPLPGARCRTRLSVGANCNDNPEDGVCQLGTTCNGDFCSE